MSGNRRVILLALFLSGCSAGIPERPDPEPTKAEASPRHHLSIDYARVRIGQSAIFRIVEDGRTSLYKVSAVADEGTDLWIEERLPPDPTKTGVPIRKTLLERTGLAREIWYGEAGGTATRLWPAPTTPLPRPAPLASPKIRIFGIHPGEGVTLSDRSYLCTRIDYEWTEGAIHHRGSDWCSADVPLPILYANRSYGGLVRRNAGGAIWEILASSQEARPELTIQR